MFPHRKKQTGAKTYGKKSKSLTVKMGVSNIQSLASQQMAAAIFSQQPVEDVQTTLNNIYSLPSLTQPLSSSIEPGSSGKRTVANRMPNLKESDEEQENAQPDQSVDYFQRQAVARSTRKKPTLNRRKKQLTQVEDIDRSLKQLFDSVSPIVNDRHHLQRCVAVSTPVKMPKNFQKQIEFLTPLQWSLSDEPDLTSSFVKTPVVVDASQVTPPLTVIKDNGIYGEIQVEDAKLQNISRQSSAKVVNIADVIETKISHDPQTIAETSVDSDFAVPVSIDAQSKQSKQVNIYQKDYTQPSNQLNSIPQVNQNRPLEELNLANRSVVHEVVSYIANSLNGLYNNLVKTTNTVDQVYAHEDATNNKNENSEPGTHLLQASPQNFEDVSQLSQADKSLELFTLVDSQPKVIYDQSVTQSKQSLDQFTCVQEAESETEYLKRAQPAQENQDNLQKVQDKLEELTISSHLNLDLNVIDRDNLFLSENVGTECQVSTDDFHKLPVTQAYQVGWLPAAERVTYSMDDILLATGQTTIPTFVSFLKQLSISHLLKIGEASFSEVFAFTFNLFKSTWPFFESVYSMTPDKKSMEVVAKVIPFGDNRDVTVNGDPQTSVSEVCQEVIVTRLLGDSSLQHNFVKCFGIAVVSGKFPSQLLRAWDSYVNTENDRPDNFTIRQQYCIFMLEFGGCDLEKFVFGLPNDDDKRIKKQLSASAESAKAQAMSLIKQCAYSLAAAERQFEFEHRDLHWGNVLIQDSQTDVIKYIMSDGSMRKFSSAKIQCVIIDYTFSRLSVGQHVVYRAYDDEAYFQGKGDYQFDIYRMMREHIDPGKSGNIELWSQYTPKTNVYWMHYLCLKCMERLKPFLCQEIEQLHNRVLRYDSVSQLIEQDVFYVKDFDVDA